MAARYLRRERADHTLQPNVLINEAYLRLVDQNSVTWENRSHFFGIAANVMRRILVDHARGHQVLSWAISRAWLQREISRPGA